MRVKRLVAFNGGSFCSARYTHRFLEHFCVSCLMGGIWKTIRRGREKKDRFIVNPCDCEILGWIYPVCDCVITWQYQSSGLCLKPPRVLCSNTHTHSRQSGGLKSSQCSYQNSLLVKNLVLSGKMCYARSNSVCFLVCGYFTWFGFKWKV